MPIADALVWFALKYRARAAESGTQVAARQLRKQGVPIEVTLALLVPGAVYRGC